MKDRRRDKLESQIKKNKYIIKIELLEKLARDKNLGQYGLRGRRECKVFTGH